jgi:hypothetical protein
MKIEKILVSGLVGMTAGWLLQKAYKVTNIYPPAPVFWFAIGGVTYIALNSPQLRRLT